jgi:predicted phosphodiesterase
VRSDVIRILSDVHFGDRASRVRKLRQLRPLLHDVSGVVLNGDTLDTRPGPALTGTADLVAEVTDFFPHEVPSATMLTGNHDPDVTPLHALDLAGGRVFAVHGDVLFDEIVPWGQDVPLVTRLMAAERLIPPPAALSELDHRLAVWRRVAGRIPQRHQSERHGVKYACKYALDTVWPPNRVLKIFAAWREAPHLAAALLRRHRPAARFIVTGHTHRPGVWRMPGGLTVINTGSFCLPLGGCAVDVTPEQITVRQVVARRGEFYAGKILAGFALAGE